MRGRALALNSSNVFLLALGLASFGIGLLPFLHVQTMVHLTNPFTTTLEEIIQSRESPSVQTINSRGTTNESFRILHIVTTLDRSRLDKPLISTLQNAVKSMLQESNNWRVDVYLILGYTLRSDERKRIFDALPKGVGLEVWDDATPFAYGFHKFRVNLLVERLPALARQHRFVVRDKINEYDFFSAWEDDMVVTSEHIKTFLRMSAEIKRLQNAILGLNVSTSSKSEEYYSNALNELQVNRLIPGFIRVEVLTENTTARDKKMLSNAFDGSVQINATVCCSFLQDRVINGIAVDKVADKVVVWETDAVALGLRFIPDSSLGWVALLPSGNPPNGQAAINAFYADALNTSGKEKATRPTYDDPKYFAQQAGWMMSREQLLHFEKYCSPKTFLPPFDHPHWKDDGLRPWNNNVEFWSGGFHLFDKCRVQRILSLDPSVFSNQLILHGANNKHKKIQHERIVLANDLLGELSAMKKVAQGQ